VTLDPRPRPTRRPARRRLPLLTALVLLTMAAGLWAWLCAPAAPASATVAAPRLHIAAVRVDEAAAAARAASTETAAQGATAIGGHHASAHSLPVTAPVTAAVTAPATHAEPALQGVTTTVTLTSDLLPAAAGPRAPPVSS